MFISNSKKFIFFHVPKCGGESITSALSNSSTFIDLEFGSTNFGVNLVNLFRPRYKVWKHSSASDIKKKIPEIFDQYKKFSIIRNPYSRAGSLYKYFKMHPNHGAHKKYDLFSFDNFLNCNEIKNDNYITKPISSFLDVDVSSIKLIKLEKIKNEWNDLLHWLGLPPCKLNHRNKSNKTDIIFTKDNCLKIEELYLKDFELFSYQLRSEDM